MIAKAAATKSGRIVSATQGARCSCKTKNPVSPPPEVTLTIGVAERRTIAPQTFPRKRNGFVSTNIGCNFLGDPRRDDFG